MNQIPTKFNKLKINKQSKNILYIINAQTITYRLITPTYRISQYNTAGTGNKSYPISVEHITNFRWNIDWSCDYELVLLEEFKYNESSTELPVIELYPNIFFRLTWIDTKIRYLIDETTGIKYQLSQLKEIEQDSWISLHILQLQQGHTYFLATN